MKKIILVILLVVTAYYEIAPSRELFTDTPAAVGVSSDALLAEAFSDGRGDIQVQGSGTVLKLLPDDNHGSRHQRFVLQLASKQTLLVAHNIDLAPKLDSLRVNDRVDFFGEYEWSKQGGVIHWTHRDPKNRHIGGWLKHNGKTYQ